MNIFDPSIISSESYPSADRASYAPSIAPAGYGYDEESDSIGKRRIPL